MGITGASGRSSLVSVTTTRSGGRSGPRGALFPRGGAGFAPGMTGWPPGFAVGPGLRGPGLLPGLRFVPDAAAGWARHALRTALPSLRARRRSADGLLGTRPPPAGVFGAGLRLARTEPTARFRALPIALLARRRAPVTIPPTARFARDATSCPRVEPLPVRPPEPSPRDRPPNRPPVSRESNPDALPREPPVPPADAPAAGRPLPAPPLGA